MIDRQEFSNVSELTNSLQKDLIALGFTLKLWRRYGERDDTSQLINPIVPETEPELENAALYVFTPQPTVDPFSLVEPWDIIVETHPNYMRVWVLTPDCYVIDEYGILSIKDMPEYILPDPETKADSLNYGYLSENYYVADGERVNFLDFREGNENWETSEQYSGRRNLSYTISTDGTGVFVGIYSQPFTDSGRHFAWFAAGRLVDSNGKITPEHSGRPVWCMYSLDGGGVGKSLEGTDETDVQVPILRPKGIRQFCVRESDIHYPTDSMSAVIPNNRFNAVINPLPQTSLAENGKAAMSRISNFSNWRYTYSKLAYLSIIGYVDAGVHSGTNKIDDSQFHYDIEYHAWLANFPYNSGMRLYIGEAQNRPIDSNVLYTLVVTDPTISFQNSEIRVHSVTVRVIDALSGQLVDAPQDYIFGVSVLPDSDVIIGSDKDTADGSFTSVPSDGIYRVREGERQTTITFGENRPGEPKNRILLFRVTPTSGIDQEPKDVEILL